jgi:hypothetical protein
MKRTVAHTQRNSGRTGSLFDECGLLGITPD